LEDLVLEPHIRHQGRNHLLFLWHLRFRIPFLYIILNILT